MTATSSPAHPFQRLIDVAEVPRNGMDIAIEADSRERGLLAADLGIVDVHRLVASFTLSGTPRRLRVRGRVEGDVRQTCVVSLEPFDEKVREEVDVSFSEDVPEHRDEDIESDIERDLPDPIIAGRIDLGALAAEFLALGLDPHPRKPGVAFAFENDDDGDEEIAEAKVSPFAKLAKLKTGGEGD